MAKGVWHDRFNLILGASVSGTLIGLEVDPVIIVGVSAGWLFSTLIFGPDSDITPKRRTQILRYFLYPYSLFFRHRGLSHHFLWGTVSRNLYLISILIFLIYLGLYLGAHLGIKGSVMEVLNSIFKLSGVEWNRDNKSLRFFLSVFLGQWVSDITHLMLDRFSDRSGLFRK